MCESVGAGAGVGPGVSFIGLGRRRKAGMKTLIRPVLLSFFWSFVSDIIEKLSIARVCLPLLALSLRKLAMFAQRNPPQHQKSAYRFKGKTLMIKVASGSV